MIRLVAIAVALALAGRASSQPVPERLVVSPDRPDVANGIQIVPVGHVEVEGGVTLTRSGGETDLALGELLVRIPLSSRVETRVQLLTYGLTPAGEERQGLLDPAVDVKWKAYDSEGTDFGLIVGTAVPLGASAYREKHLQPYATFALDQELSEKTWFTLNAGAQRGSADGEVFTQLFGGISFGVQLSKPLSLFVEGYLWSRTEPDGPGAQLLDGGLQLLVTDRLMLDVRAGAGAGRTAPDFFVGVGAGFLF